MVANCHEFYNGVNFLPAGAPEDVRYWGCLLLSGVAPYFDLKILGVLNATILPISRNIGGAIAPPVPPVPAPQCFLGAHTPLMTRIS